jgi:hypothetical protein
MPEKISGYVEKCLLQKDSGSRNWRFTHIILAMWEAEIGPAWGRPHLQNNQSFKNGEQDGKQLNSGRGRI